MVQSTITASPSPKLTLPVDAEHSGIRGAVIVAFIAVWFIVYSITDSFISSEGFNLIALGAGFLSATLVTQFLEGYLKKHWHSGRHITVDHESVELEKKGTIQAKVLSEDPVNALFWRFEVNKRTRIPKGWSMIAAGLEFEGTYLIAYSFISPDQLETFERADWFTKLASKKELSNARDEMRLAGEQRRLIEAENYRWMNGAEMNFENFQTYLTKLETQFPEWMPNN